MIHYFYFKLKMTITIRTDLFDKVNCEHSGIKNVDLFTLSNRNIEVQVINYGATITSIKTPDKFGNVEDIVLGFDKLQQYINHTYYFGCTVGRFANRIAQGQFTVENKTYSLAINNGPNHLHGGLKGFDKVIWDAEVKDNAVLFSYTSPSMEENYPGNLKCTVLYKLTDKDELIIHYEATTTHTTPVNLTNHSYFNLAGHGSGKIHDQLISINADYYIPVDEASIPIGSLNAVESTSFDLRETKSFDVLLKLMPDGFDHTFCINGNLNSERKVATVHHPQSGRSMEVYSTQPGVQLYTANYLPEDESMIGKNGKSYKRHGAFCLETQNYPDAVNHVNFPTAFLGVGDVYSHTTRFAFTLK